MGWLGFDPGWFLAGYPGHLGRLLFTAFPGLMTGLVQVGSVLFYLSFHLTPAIIFTKPLTSLYTIFEMIGYHMLEKIWSFGTFRVNGIV